jgi:TonB-linked SusC/RagA family outer membrane protein
MKKTFTQCFNEFSTMSGKLSGHSETQQKALTYRWLHKRLYVKVLPLLLMALMVSPHLVLASTNSTLFYQQQETVTVKGTVLDDTDNNPLPGVTISDAQHKAYGLTDINGNFTVKVPKGVEISFTSVSYTTEKRSFTANQEKVSIRLSAAKSELSEVVVTALGIKREAKSLGYASTEVKGEQLTDAMSSNWTDALSGKVAGLNLVRSGSGPAGSNKIILRGENNLTGDNEALVVVDGVVTNRSSGKRRASASDQVYGTGSDNMPADYGSSINDINPEDIESVNVLKGPAAAALYGQAGANGAVIITTKSGNSKRKGLGLSYNSNFYIDQPNRWPDLQYQYGQGLAGAPYYSYGATVDGASTSGTSSAYGPKFDGQSFFQYDPVTQKVGTTRTPWVPYTDKIHDFFDTGKTLVNGITVDGGTDKTTARFSATNTRNNWIAPNTGYNRNIISMSVNSKVNDKLTIASKVTYINRSSDNLPGAGYGNQSLMYWFIFWQPSADPDWLKDYWKIGQVGRVIQFPFSSFPENPYAVSYEFLNKQNRNSITGNIQATYNFSKYLSLQLRTSLDMGYEQREQDRPYDAGSKLIKGSYRTQHTYNQEVSSDFLLKYQRKIIKPLDVSLTLGGSTVTNKYTKDELRADSLTYPGLYAVSNAAGPLVSMPDQTQFTFNSVYALLSLSYKDYLYVDATGRQDYASTLATPSRTANSGFFYPSVSASFLLSEFTKLPELINYAKIRASVAGVGSGSDIPYRTSYNYQIAGGGQYPSSALQNPSLLPNANLKPLRTTTYELGTEVKMFKNRFGFDFAVYAGNTKNQILTRYVDRSSGYTQILINLGQVDNKGIELAVNGTPVQTKSGFKWMMNATFAANRNKIVELADSSVILRTGPVAGGQIVATVGGSMGDLYGRGFVRSPDGQVVYDPTTGFAKISPDVVYLGNTSPKFKGSWGSDFSYKNFRLHVLFDAQVGAVAHSLTNYKLVEQGKLMSTVPGRYNGIIGNGVIQNPDGSYRPNDVTAYDIDGYYRSQMGADNAEGSTFSTDFIKFREATFDYTFSPRMIKRLGLQRLSLGVYGRDLFIWSPWPIFDPEFGTLAGSDIVQGFEVAQFPSTRTFGVKLSVGF